MIWIRADANSEIGSGHMMRCLSIADACRKLGEQVCFLIADEGGVELLSKRGHDYIVLGTDYQRMEEELHPGMGERQLQRLLGEHPHGLLLIDSYFVTEQYLKTLREYAKVVYMDDIPRFAYPVDAIVNYNIYGEDMEYDRETEKFFLGPKFAPLREQFQDVEYQVSPLVKNVLITTGGSDKYNLAGKILEEVLIREEIKELCYHVVSGVFNPHQAYLEQLAKEHSNIKLQCNVTDMAGLMKECDIAITAGGSTMYELSAVGVPTLCFSFVDNQELIVENFYRKGLVVYGGNYLKEQEAFAGNVAEALSGLWVNTELRRGYSSRQRALVDGKGAFRLAGELCKMTKW